MAPVEEDRKLDVRGSPKIDQRGDGGPNGAAGEDHLVDEHNSLSANVERHVGSAHSRTAFRIVVAVQRDVELADRNLNALDLLDQRAQTLGKRRAAAQYSDQADILRAVVLLEYL